MAVAASTLVRDILFFIKDDISTNVTDPISSTRGSSSSFVMTSFPQRAVEYPLIVIKMTNAEVFRAGMQTTNMDYIINIEVRVWARNQKEKPHWTRLTRSSKNPSCLTAWNDATVLLMMVESLSPPKAREYRAK